MGGEADGRNASLGIAGGVGGAERPGYFQNVRREIEPLLPARVESVLEVGCAAGGTMRWLRSIRDVKYAAGVEQEPEAARAARLVFDDVEIGDAAASDFGFRQERFDLILALDVLEHLADPWTILRRLREKLAKDGVFIASVPNVAHYKVSLNLFLRGRWDYAEEGLLDRTHLRFFTRRTAVELFESTGYSVRRVLATFLCPNLFCSLWISEREGRWYSQKPMRFLVPKRFVEFQYLIAVGRSGEDNGPGMPEAGAP
jgi:SAM-dependent methyltransferase